MLNQHTRRKGTEKYMSKNIFRILLMLTIAMLLLFLVSRCGWGFQSPEVDWYYIIPNNYQGFLVIRYECAGGRPLVIQDGKAQIEFNDDGTACISNAFQASHGQVFAASKSGEPIKVSGAGAPWNEKGYALYGDGVRSIERYGVDYGAFEILWVGDMEYLAKHYLEGLDQFLEDRFGVPTVK